MNPGLEKSFGTHLFAQANGVGFGNGLGIMPLIIMIGVLFYFMVLRPETKRRSNQETMHGQLKKNDRIVTIGGIHGTITNVTSPDDVTIRIDDKTDTKIRITRTAVQKVVDSKDSSSDA